MLSLERHVYLWNRRHWYYFELCGRHFGYQPPSTSAMVAGGLDVLCVVKNKYIVFGTTCLFVTTAKLLLLPVSQPPFSIFDIAWHRPISLEIRMFVHSRKSRCYRWSDTCIRKASDIISTSGFMAAILNINLPQRRQYHYWKAWPRKYGGKRWNCVAMCSRTFDMSGGSFHPPLPTNVAKKPLPGQGMWLYNLLWIRRQLVAKHVARQVKESGM